MGRTFLNSVVRIFQQIGGITLFAMMFLVTLNIVSRFFVTPIFGVYDLTQLGMVVIFFSSLGSAQLRKSNISIDYFVLKLPHYLQDYIDIFIYIIYLLLASLIFWRMIEYAQRSYHSGHISVDLNLPIYLFIFFASIGAAVWIAVVVNDFIDAFKKVRRKN